MLLLDSHSRIPLTSLTYCYKLGQAGRSPRSACPASDGQCLQRSCDGREPSSLTGACPSRSHSHLRLVLAARKPCRLPQSVPDFCACELAVSCRSIAACKHGSRGCAYRAVAFPERRFVPSDARCFMRPGWTYRPQRGMLDLDCTCLPLFARTWEERERGGGSGSWRLDG